MEFEFNPHGNTTVDGTPITVGLEVIDYNRDRTTVVADRDVQDWKCCGQHARRNDLSPDYADGCNPGCSHDHWFTTANGGMFNGSRLQAVR